MSNNSGYDNREPDSQVRSIIKQLNEERPSKEKSREVVVRADGTKAIRVVKKRKVMISGEEKSRKAKKRFLYTILTLFILGGLLAGFVTVRMSSMSSDSYIQEKQEELRQAWGAKSVRCVGARVNGFTFTVESVVMDFPEESMIEHVELKNISAVLSLSSFFSGVLQGDELVIGSAEVRVRGDVETLSMPSSTGKELWKFKRISCPRFSFSIGDEAVSPLVIKQSSAYAYSPNGGNESLAIMFEGGELSLRGMDSATIEKGKLLLSRAAVEDLSFRCTVPDPSVSDAELRPQFIISGKIENGGNLTGPYRFASRNVRFDQLSGRRFARFFAATSNEDISVDGASASYVRLPFNNQPLAFFGKFIVKDVSVFSFPAQNVLNRHIRIPRTQSARMLSYTPIVVGSGKVELTEQDGVMTLTLVEVLDPERIWLKGTVSVNAEHALSGSLEYGIPETLALSEYTDQLPDRIFSDDGSYAWLTTSLSGNSATPQDNGEELDAAQEHTRTDRRRSADFDNIVDRMVSSGSTSPGTSESGTPASAGDSSSTATPAPELPQQPMQPQLPQEPQQPQQSEQPQQPAVPSLQPQQPQPQQPAVPSLQLPEDDLGNPGGGGLSLPTDGQLF